MPVAVGVMADSYNKPVTSGPPLSGLVGWWDAADAATITSSAGKVSQWSTKAGTSHWTQATGTAQPSTGIETMNGKNVITFPLDAGNYWMNISANPCAAAAGGTVFWVVKNFRTNADAAATPGAVSGLGPATGDFHPFGGGVIYSGFGSTTRPAMNTMVSDLRIAHVASLRAATSSWEWWLNGVSQYSNTSNVVAWNTSPATTMFLGNNSTNCKFRGQMAEILLYNVALDTTTRQQAEAYLKTKWGTP